MERLGWDHKGLRISDYTRESPMSLPISLEEAEELVQEQFDKVAENLRVLNNYKARLLELKEKGMLFK